MPGPVFPGKNMPQKRKEKSLFSVAPQGISGIFRKKARLAPFFGKKPAEENAPPAFPRLMRAPEKNGARCGTPLPGAGAARHARKSPGQARPQAAPRKKLLPPRMPCRRETMRHAAFPKAIPTGAAEKRRSRMLPVSCRGIRPALCASAFPPPHGRPETAASPPASPGPAEAGLSPRCRTARRRSSSPQKSRPSQGLQLHAFPAAPLFFGNDAAWKAHPGKAAFLRFFPAEARLFRPWTEQNAGKLRKNVIFS